MSAKSESFFGRKEKDEKTESMDEGKRFARKGGRQHKRQHARGSRRK
jgi:hypothetical protein